MLINLTLMKPSLEGLASLGQEGAAGHSVWSQNKFYAEGREMSMNVFKLSAVCATYATVPAMAGCSRNRASAAPRQAARSVGSSGEQAQTAQRASLCAAQSANEPHGLRVLMREQFGNRYFQCFAQFRECPGRNPFSAYFYAGQKLAEISIRSSLLQNFSLVIFIITKGLTFSRALLELQYIAIGRIKKLCITSLDCWLDALIRLKAKEQGLKAGVRKFDPAQPPASPRTAFNLTQDAISASMLPPEAIGEHAPVFKYPKYQIRINRAGK
jgi:hypothetical protein